MPVLLVLTCIATLTSLAWTQDSGFALSAKQRAAAIKAMGDLAVLPEDAHERLLELHRRAHETAGLLGPESLHAAALAKVLVEATGQDLRSPAERAELLKRELQLCRYELSFRPTEEADRPAGFPDFTTVGELELKRYPKHRLARTTMPWLLGQTRGFFTLFDHIKSNDIAMTAPVEMRYDENENMKPLTMSFLYGDDKIGKLGRDGDVEVLDIEPATMISMGFNGIDREERVEAAGKMLQTWIVRNSDRYEHAGSLRVMGWNGPGVRGMKRYFEVQIPIRAKKID